MLEHQNISRQIDLVPVGILHTPITIIGAGAIGSWTALSLAKMGFENICVYDHDDVDVVNMSSQFYGYSDIGHKKVHMLAQRIQHMTKTNISAVAERWNGSKSNGIVIMAVDSMEVRKQIFEANKLNLGCNFIIDSRMGSELALLYTIDPSNDKDISFYEKTLYTDKESVQERCTAKSTTYTAVILSGLVTKTVRDVLIKHKYLRNLAFSLKESDFLAFCEKR